MGLSCAERIRRHEMSILTRLCTKNTRLIKGLRADVSGLRKASSAILSLYIKEIDVLTKEKLHAIRRMRAVLTGIERDN